MTSVSDSGSSSDQGNRRFDWSAAYERLDAILAKLDASENPTAEQTRLKLRERALRYARPVPSTADIEYQDVIAFEVDGNRFAVDAASSSAVASLAGLTAVPGLPSFYLGLISHRGSVFPVLDVHPLMGASRGDHKNMRFAVLVRGDGGALGLAASEITGFTRFRTDQITAVIDESARHRAILGIGPNTTTIIDTARLLQDIRLLVDDQPNVVVRNEGDGL